VPIRFQGATGIPHRHRTVANTVTERIRQIFFIAVANFIFPLIMNIAQLICITTSRSYAVGTMFMLINSYVSVIGVLCATIWASGSEWARTHQSTVSENTQRSSQGRNARLIPLRAEVGEPDVFSKQPACLPDGDDHVLEQYSVQEWHRKDNAV